MNDEKKMCYCPCCGEFRYVSENSPCKICKTPMIYSGIELSKWSSAVSNDKRKSWRIEILKSKVINNSLFNQEQWNKREQVNNEHDGLLDIPHCPICNSTNLEKISGANKVGSAMVFGVFSLGHISKTFKCKSCGMKF